MNSPKEQIREEIRRNGPMSFARFMEIALYWPQTGYYEAQKSIGRAGDFFTSVSTGSLFAELLGFKFAIWLDDLAKSGVSMPMQIVEAGAHNGQLASDLLQWFSHNRPSLYDRIEYILIEPSSTRQSWQKEKLRDFLGKVRWTNGIGAVSQTNGIHGIIFSNELLDAMPAHRLRWNATSQSWAEWRICTGNNAFSWEAGDLTASLGDYITPTPDELKPILPDGFTIEVSPAAIQWWRQAASSLRHGKLITIDYGLIDNDVFAPHRRDGTARAYINHQVSGDLLSNPGFQDLTAHVNFSAVRQTGESEGLVTEAFVSQAQFLTGIFELTMANKAGFGEWTRQRIRQFQTLTHPEHLGHSFRVLVQTRPTIV